MTYNQSICKQYYEKNREQILEKRREYYKENRAKILERQKTYNAEHKDAKRIYDKKRRSRS